MFNPFPTDAQLIRKCLHGQSNAFGVLYDRHAGRVFRLLRQLTGDATEAEDLTQETFLAAHQALGAWRGEGAFSTWLCGIAYRRYASRRREQPPDCEPLDLHLELSVQHGDPFAHCTRHEREQRITNAIAALPTVCRDVFVLVKVEGLAYREAAHLLDVPVGTVQSRLWRATRLLQVSLASDNPRAAHTERETHAGTTPITPRAEQNLPPEPEPEMPKGGRPNAVRDCA